MIIRSFIIYILVYLYKAYKKETFKMEEFFLIMFMGINLFFIPLYFCFVLFNQFLIKKESETAVLIEHGVLNFNNIVRLNYSLENLFLKTKEAGFNSFEEVNYAVLKDGVISFMG